MKRNRKLLLWGLLIIGLGIIGGGARIAFQSQKEKQTSQYPIANSIYKHLQENKTERDTVISLFGPKKSEAYPAKEENEAPISSTTSTTYKDSLNNKVSDSLYLVLPDVSKLELKVTTESSDIMIITRTGLKEIPEQIQFKEYSQDSAKRYDEKWFRAAAAYGIMTWLLKKKEGIKNFDEPFAPSHWTELLSRAYELYAAGYYEKAYKVFKYTLTYYKEGYGDPPSNGSEKVINKLNEIIKYLAHYINENKRKN